MVEKFLQDQDVQKLVDVFPNLSSNGYYNVVPLIPQDQREDILAAAQLSNRVAFCRNGVCIESQKDEDGHVVLFAEENTAPFDANGWIEELISDKTTSEEVDNLIYSTLMQIVTVSHGKLKINHVQNSLEEYRSVVNSLQESPHLESEDQNKIKKERFATIIRNVGKLNKTLRVNGIDSYDAPNITDELLRKRLGLLPQKVPNLDQI